MGQEPPEKIRIRPEHPADFAAIHDAVAAAFNHTAEADLVEAIRASPNYIAELSLVAESDGAVCGHVMISYGTLRSPHGTVPVPLLSPLAVAPQRQRRGIGAALIRTVCSLADEHGHPLVLLEGDPGYYGRFGFEPANKHGIELPLPDWAPRDAGQILRLEHYDSGLVGAVIYPEYFDQATLEREG